MGPRSDDEFALPGFRRPSTLNQAVEINKGVLCVEVIPAAHVKRRGINLAPFGFNVDFVPIVIVGCVFNPIFPELKFAPGEFVHLNDRQFSERFRPVMVFDALGSPSVGTHSPSHEHIELERPAGIDQSAIKIVADDARHHAGQKFAAVGCTLPLHQSHIRPARHAYFSVTPLLLTNPFLSIVTVRTVIHERIVLAI